jgi:UDPglucose 6-dehydrogenase
LDITVIGLGYVGTVAAANLAAAGHQVVGVDIDPDRIALLQAGALPFYEPGLGEMVQSSIAAGCLQFEHRDAVDRLDADVALIATGTPQTEGGGADLNQVRAALAWIKSRHPRDTVVVMKSTVPPGTGQRVIEYDLEGTGVRYVSNPEFLREGQAVADWQNPDRIVIGAGHGDADAIAAVKAMHAGIEAPYVITDITSAEMIKYASNAFLATRISFINEIAALCDSLGASIDAVSQGLAMDSRTGSRIHAGVGYGGSCLPRDVGILEQLALAGGVKADLLRSVAEVNNGQRLLPLQALRRRFNSTLAGLKAGVLGLAFKPGTDDVRDAPGLDLVRALAAEGVDTAAFDPVATETARPQLPSTVRLANSVVEAAEQAHALVLMTEWEEIVNADWETAVQRMSAPRFLFDGRNALDPELMTSLGFEYTGVGRNTLSGVNPLAAINTGDCDRPSPGVAFDR